MLLLDKLYEGVLLALPDRHALSLDFLRRHGSLPDLQHPKTFSEKVLYRKLHDRDTRLCELSDKVAAKVRVAGILGEDWIIPTLWHGRALPERRLRDWPIPYVMKANHGSGWNLFVMSAADQGRIERLAQGWLRQVQGKALREWAYSRIEPQLLVEPYIGDTKKLPTDYKFFVFGGKVHYIQVDLDRLTDHRRTFFDRHWNNYPLEPGPIPPPQSFDRMLSAAERLGADFAFVRVDLYEIDGRPRFGEMTFYPASGRKSFSPRSADRMLGDLWP
jgi:hypothetical protein